MRAEPTFGFQAVFRQRLRDGETLYGTFVKTASHQVIEVLGRTAFDFVVIDAEHAPFAPQTLDACLLAAQAVGTSALVRVADAGAAAVQQVLDMGAGGIMAPHITSAATALAAARACRYDRGTRGFSNSPRAGSYGDDSLAQHLTQSDARVVCLCQIEDADALDHLDAIAQLDAVDCLFIGRADLAVSLGQRDVNHPQVADAVARICAAGQAHGMPVGMFLPDAAQVDHFRAVGVSVFVLGSDQSLLRTATRHLLDGRGQPQEP